MSRIHPLYRHSTRLLHVLLALAAASCGDPSSPTNAGDVDGPAFAADATRAMKISAGVLLVSDVVPAPAPCLQLSNSVITGTATHLGRFEGTGSTCILDIVAPDPSPPWTAPGPPPYATATFTNPLWVLTAANGDELRLEGQPATCVISLVDMSLRCGAPGQTVHVITGGTGRFAGATGELQSSAVNADGLGPDDFESRGWIRF